jgi:uncharacterized protein
MTQKEVEKNIREIENRVRTACLSPANVFGKGIWDHHIKWVVKFGDMLAEKTGADHLTVHLAALLHDYASIKSFALYTNHHVHGAKEAERILGPMGFDARIINGVSHCILTHRGSMKIERRTIEAHCVADADAMAHFVGVPSLLAYATQGKGLEIDVAILWVQAKLLRSWNKLSPTAKTLAQNYYDAALELLSDTVRVEEILLFVQEGIYTADSERHIL